MLFPLKKYHTNPYLDKKAWNVISHHSLFTAVFSSKLYKLDRLDRDYSVRLINRNWIQLSSENSILQQNFNSFHISLFSTTKHLVYFWSFFCSEVGEAMKAAEVQDT